MRRLRKGRAHAGVMGGDATPTSGAVTVRIYCSATQQRLKVPPCQCVKPTATVRVECSLATGELMRDS